MCVLCLIRVEIVRWVLIGVATLTSGLFLMMNFRRPLFDHAGAKCVPCCFACALARSSRDECVLQQASARKQLSLPVTLRLSSLLTSERDLRVLRRALPVWLGLGALHVGLGLAMKLFFFRFTTTLT